MATKSGSKPGSQTVRRPPTKRRLIVEELRSRVVRGDFPPGSQLPTRADLVLQYRTSSLTVHAALARLTRDGLVVSRGRQGTFVVDRPPHLFTYAIAFPSSPSCRGWAKHWTAMTNEAHAMEAATTRRFKLFHGVNSVGDTSSQEALTDEAKAQKLAGIIFAAPPGYLGECRLFEAPPGKAAGPAVPMVSISADEGTFPGVPCIFLDYRSLVAKSLDLLAAKGARRIACIMGFQMGDEFIRQLTDGMTARGMATRPQWIQGLPISPGPWAGRLVRLLLEGKRNERPDGLFILDDNLIEDTTAGIVQAGITDPRELKVVAHCNFPWPAPSHFALNRVGFDIRDTLETGCGLIDARRAGKSVPEMTRQTALREDEVPGRGG